MCGTSKDCGPCSEWNEVAASKLARAEAYIIDLDEKLAVAQCIHSGEQDDCLRCKLSEAQARIAELERERDEARRTAQAREMGAAQAGAVVMGLEGTVERLLRERDEARAEVARLKELVEKTHKRALALAERLDSPLDDECGEEGQL